MDLVWKKTPGSSEWYPLGALQGYVLGFITIFLELVLWVPIGAVNSSMISN